MNIKKKRVVVLAVGMLMVMSTSAFAHGHSGGHHSNSNRTNTTKYTVCSATNCDLTYNHSHNGTTYGGHHSEDGHKHNYN